MELGRDSPSSEQELGYPIYYVAVADSSVPAAAYEDSQKLLLELGDKHAIAPVAGIPLAAAHFDTRGDTESNQFAAVKCTEQGVAEHILSVVDHCTPHVASQQIRGHILVPNILLA